MKHLLARSVEVWAPEASSRYEAKPDHADAPDTLTRARRSVGLCGGWIGRRAATTLVLVVLVGAMPSEGASARTASTKSAVFFDDFTYVGFSPQLAFWRHGWKIRTEQGWPGMPAARWSADGISFIKDPTSAKNELLRMSSSTDGTAAGTQEAQVCQQRKFREGTWATRIHFTDAPRAGPDGDQIVEGFYGISPLVAPLDPDYSEMDWEYLPNGGWGMSDPTLWTTTWETARLDPWLADNVTLATSGSLAGWHTLVIQVGNGTVTYHLDGTLRVSHGGKYYPETAMSLNYTTWFIDGGLLASGATRSYVQYVDWAFEAPDALLSPQQVLSRIHAFRKVHLKFRDTVPVPEPPLDSPCNF
jgi:hypothetical protein